MSRGLPPLELAVEVADPSGVRTRWDPSDRVAGNRPQGLSFNTKRGEGFAEGNVTLARRIDQDYVDLHLFDDVVISGYDGSVAYEGRIGAQPRSFDATHSITVQMAGWMSHARDKPFTEIYVDRDLGAWHEPSRGRQASLLAGNFSIGQLGTGRDSTNSAPALTFNFTGGWTSPFKPTVEAWYDAGPGNQIASAYFQVETTTNVNPADANWQLVIGGGSTDAATNWTGADQLTSALSTFGGAVTASRHIALVWWYGSTPAGGDGVPFQVNVRNIALYGDHGLQLVGADPAGVTASQAMIHIASAHCPKLNTDGVQPTTWQIPHLVFKDPTDPYDAFLELNKYHLWELAVWEDKTLTFGPADRSDHDWEVRLSDFGVKVNLQGDTTEDLANGVIVDFQNVQQGAQDRVTPEDATDLADRSETNPANLAGIQRWAKIQLSSPTTRDSAVQIGRAALAEFNQPKSPGTISVVGHVKDRAGHWQPAWKVRAGDTIAITDHPNNTPRLITETQWNHDSKELQVTVDSVSKKLDASFDRLATALGAAGLG